MPHNLYFPLLQLKGQMLLSNILYQIEEHKRTEFIGIKIVHTMKSVIDKIILKIRLRNLRENLKTSELFT